MRKRNAQHFETNPGASNILFKEAYIQKKKKSLMRTSILCIQFPGFAVPVNA